MILSWSFWYFSASSSLLEASMRTTEVGFLVSAATPSSIRLRTKMQGMALSSQRTGMWLMTSTGVTSAARMTTPLAPFLMAFTTSFTPRFRFFSRLRWRANLRILPRRVSLARGVAMGEWKKVSVCSASIGVEILQRYIYTRMHFFAKQVEDNSKEPSIYMRFHVTLERAMNLITHLYQERNMPGTNVSLLDHAVQIAGLTEEIESQDYLDYHLTWLTGVLKDLPAMFPDQYRDRIDEVLQELKTEEAVRVKRYVEQLSGDPRLPKGERCRRLADRVNEMDAIPCYIQIFELYSYCSLWKKLNWVRPKVQYDGFMAFAYMFFYKAISKHLAIGKNLKQDIKGFFKALLDEMGGMGGIRTKTEAFYRME